MAERQKLLIIAGSGDEFQVLRTKALAASPDLTILPFRDARELQNYTILVLAAPDVILMDGALFDPDWAAVFRRAFPRHFNCSFIFLCGEETDTNFIYSQIGSAHILFRDTPEENFSGLLSRLLYFSQIGAGKVNYLFEAARYYFNNVFIHSIALSKSVSEINSSFGFMFREGLFRVVTIKLDYRGDPRTAYGGLLTAQQRIERNMLSVFMRSCYEVIICRMADGVVLSLNYAERNRKEIERIIGEMLPLLRGELADLTELFVTVCPGGEYESIVGLQASNLDSRAEVCARRVLGCNRLITRNDAARFTAPQDAVSRFDELNERAATAFLTYDSDSFDLVCDELFKAPEAVLGSVLFFHNIRQIASMFFNAHEGEMWKYADVPGQRDLMFYLLDMCMTVKDLKETLKREFRELTEDLMMRNNKFYSPNIQEVIAYIGQHYAEDVSLSSIAESVGLSQSYLSSSFKAETGMGISNYLGYIRTNEACRLLTSTNGSVSEIADAVGIEDSTYFTKLFKKNLGVTPTEYRKLYK